MAMYEKRSDLNSNHLKQTEVHLYGSSRLGILTTNRDVETAGSPGNGIFQRGNKFFELSNHLGNVLATVSDRRVQVSTGGINVEYYQADVVSASDYYPFGMSMPGRKYEAQSGYRYGFNGKEKDKDLNSLTAYDYGFRIYNPALAKFLSVDPLSGYYPWYTPYQFAGNMPIWAIDLDGLEPELSTQEKPKELGAAIVVAKKPKEATRRSVYSHSISYGAGGTGGAIDVNKSQYYHRGSKTYGTKSGWYDEGDYINLLIKQGNGPATDYGHAFPKFVKPYPIYPDGYYDKGSPESMARLLLFINEVGTPEDEFYGFLGAGAGKFAVDLAMHRSGFIEPSSFNVEDLFLIGIVVKSAFKTLYLASKTIPLLRQAYIIEVRGLSATVNEMRVAGKSSEEIARHVHELRRNLGIKYKDLTPKKLLDDIYSRNLKKYGDKLGPTIEYLQKQGKSWEDIIESACRPGGGDISF